MRYRGIVSEFDDRKGMGFIVPKEDPDGEDKIFVHYSVIEAEGYRTLVKGQEVEYDLVTGEKGLSARHVKIIKNDADNTPPHAPGSIDDVVN